MFVNTHFLKKTRYCAPSFVRHAEPNPHVRQVRVGLFSTYLSHYASQYRVFRRVQNKANCKHTQNTSRILRLVLWRMCRVKLVQSVLIQALTLSKTECEEQRRRGRERRAPDESTKLRVRSVFLHQRNEWHNEATPLNVRAP